VKIEVALIHRNASQGGHSIEGLFSAVCNAMPDDVAARSLSVPCASRGIIRRVVNALWSAQRQQRVNHITGDIHYVAFLLKPGTVVITIHDCGTVENSAGLRRFLLKWLWFTLPVRLAHRIAVVSEFTKEAVLRHTGVAAEKVVVIPNCISPVFEFRPKAFNSVNPLILQIGTGRNKNIPVLAAALQGIPCRLLIVGELTGATRDALERNCIAYSSDANLRFEEIVEAYRQCDLVSFVSLYEGFGLPIVEAQATGRAVITSDRAPMSGVAGNGACLVDPTDTGAIRAAFLRMIADPVYRLETIRLGVENSTKYIASETAAQYAALYRDVAGSTRVMK
jgi:glycosyltransferase involved in cell wall biosynthesis